MRKVDQGVENQSIVDWHQQMTIDRWQRAPLDQLKRRDVLRVGQGWVAGSDSDHIVALLNRI
ncbi:MAG: hypothetical protein Q27BB25_00705 [Blastomonas sp. CACIA14H2]|uniref:hypothetical protein n=1 Tax=unclassified Blastomonas TaxID=2626550 RepID=UPI0003D03ECA|nr:MAG: hypothetical protein Q27BB25_00705 [Blastomonas sp. CACIA14H2]